MLEKDTAARSKKLADRPGLAPLDEILGNTSELAIVEHATDSHGQTLARPATATCERKLGGV